MREQEEEAARHQEEKCLSDRNQRSSYAPTSLICVRDSIRRAEADAEGGEQRRVEGGDGKNMAERKEMEVGGEIGVSNLIQT
jgi:hypothetical protein